MSRAHSIVCSLVVMLSIGCSLEPGDLEDDHDPDGIVSVIAQGPYRLVRSGSGKCLDVNGAGTSNGTNIQQWSCNGTGAQSFRLESLGGDKYKLVNTSSEKCVDVNGGSNSSGANVQIWSCNSSNAQRWTLELIEEEDEEEEDDDGLVWHQANLTWFTSYPDPGSDECENYNGCMWAGYFAFVDGQQSEAWVMSHNIAAVHSNHADQYALKTLRVRQGSHEIDVVVYDMCSDDDCDGCCTENSSETGFLIDLESYTVERFGSSDGIVDWACLDCD